MTTDMYLTQPEEEEDFLRMTFQVAMLGTDGVVVASDRRQIYHQPKTLTETASNQPTTKFKFAKNADETVICAFAGGPSSEPTADAIVSRCAPKLCPDKLSWKDAVVDVAAGIRKLGDGMDEIIVVRPDILGSVLVVTKQNLYPANGTWVMDKLCTGLNVPSRFLVQHFWRPVPVEELKLLALMAVAFAAKENPVMIGDGIDLLVVRNSKPSWSYYAEDNAEVIKAINGFKKHTAGRLFNPSRLASSD